MRADGRQRTRRGSPGLRGALPRGAGSARAGGRDDRPRRARGALRRAAAASTASPLEAILGELEARSAGGLAGGTGGRYFGYVTGGSLPAAAIVEAWTAAVDQNPGMWPLGPAARRARAGDDPLARRSARLPGRIGLLRLGRDDGEHRRPRGRAALVRSQARRGRRTSRACARCPSSASTPRRSCTSPITRRCARSASARAACARSRSTSATRCASTCSPRRSSATAPRASSRRS